MSTDAVLDTLHRIADQQCQQIELQRAQLALLKQDAMKAVEKENGNHEISESLNHHDLHLRCTSPVHDDRSVCSTELRLSGQQADSTDSGVYFAGEPHRIRSSTAFSSMLSTTREFESTKSIKDPFTMSDKVTQVLMLTGVLPEFLFEGSQEMTYRIYRRVMVFAFVFACLWHVKGLYMALMLLDLGMSDVAMPSMCLVVLTVVSLPFWRIWAQQYASDGSSMGLMQQVLRQPSSNERLYVNLRAYWFVTIAIDIALIGIQVISWATGVSYTQLAWEQGDYWSNIVGTVGAVADLLGVPSMCIWAHITVGEVWLVGYTSSLHACHLLYYADTVVAVLEDRDAHRAAANVPRILKRYETTITERLRAANRTWIPFTMWFLLTVGMVILSSCMYMLLMDVEDTLVALYVLALAIAVLFCVSMAVPIARVASTFEYDVLRALNQPVVLNRAQEHFGQQLLSHLVHLDWGFRFGGTVISSRFVMNIVTAITVLMISSVSKTVFMEWSAAS